MSPKRARIKDIAELAGVSIGTVDRVLHDRGEVAEKTRENILKIAKDLEYSPNVIARALKSKKRVRLVSLLPEPVEESAFWMKHPEGIQKALKELDPFPVNLEQVTFDMLDERDFQSKSEELIRLNPDGVILAPIFKNEALTLCEKLTRSNIPFVFIDGFLEETSFLCYTGENIYQSGRVAAQLVNMVTPPEKEILIINIARNISNVHHLNVRTQGFISYFQEDRQNRLTSYAIYNPQTDFINRELKRILRQHKNTGSIFVTGSKSYKIADYFESEGINSVNIIGYDLLENNVKYLKTGKIRFLIGQRPEEQAYKGVRKLFDFISMNKTPEKMEYLPIDVVTSENVQFFL
ncbi:MAG TPA: LacI family DNA-binding transcriptional regulator [Bacteroidales bacterium]|nr:LacI family DNA-binding transcriptional regulator [Bacteroidales bacterium]